MRNFIILFLIATCLVACQESLEERCARETKEYTRKNCPIAVDEFTTQDSLSDNASTNTIHFYYSISGDTDKLRLPIVRTILLNELRNTTNFKIYKDEGFNFAYTYRSKADGEILCEHSFSNKDYDNSERLQEDRKTTRTKNINKGRR